MNLLIVIITFHSKKEIKNLITSLSVYRSKKTNIIIVDNASIDETFLSFKKLFPDIHIVKNRKNLGFAKAANQGAKIAKGEYLLFLNPDTVVNPETVQTIIKVLKSKKDAPIVGCKTFNKDGSLQPSCGNFPTISNIILDRIPILNKIFSTELIRNEKYYEKEQTPDWVSGAFFLVKKSIFEELGGFDEQYFLYVEDVDFCYRAKKAGYKIYYTPNASIIHFDQGKSKERKKFKALQMRRGFSLFFSKHKPSFYLNLWKMLLFIEKHVNPHIRSL